MYTWVKKINLMISYFQMDWFDVYDYFRKIPTTGLSKN